MPEIPEMTKIEFARTLCRYGLFKPAYREENGEYDCYVICEGVSCDSCDEFNLFDVCANIRDYEGRTAYLSPKELEEFYSLYPEYKIIS